MMHSGRQMYKQLGVDVEPNWFLVFKLLQKYKRLSVTEIAAKIHFSHPSVVGIVNKMIKNDYLVSHTDELDSRKRQVTLSKKAMEKLPELEKVWAAGTEAVASILPEKNDFLELITHLEDQLSTSGFMKRTLKQLESNESVLRP